MKRRAGCPVCGGTATVHAVDNHGRPYVGCASCVIVLPKKLEQPSLDAQLPGVDAARAAFRKHFGT